MPATRWRRLKTDGWYGKATRQVDIVTRTALWGSAAGAKVSSSHKPSCTDPLDILRWFVYRWSTEVTFAEVCRHLGVETQRQWPDRVIARTTPALLGLFSLVTLWVNESCAAGLVKPRPAA